MNIMTAGEPDIPELYRLQLLAFESEAAMIGSRDVPALQETEDDFQRDFAHWTTLKLVTDEDVIVGVIRYRHDGDIVDVGRLMTHPDYRRQGLAEKLLEAVDSVCAGKTRELYTCTKSCTNITRYEKLGYRPGKEVTEATGLSFVYMRKE